MVLYGADEISGIVLDVGQCWTRVGFAGEDTPSHVFPTAVGQVLNDQNNSDMMEIDGTSKKNVVGELNINYRQVGMEMKNPFVESMIEDWNLLESIWSYALSNRLRVDVKETPILLTESVFNMKESREKLVELLFEKFESPATFLAKNPVLSSFSAGKPTGLVLDIGAGSTSATPIFDGYALKGASFKQSIGGDFITREALHMLEATKGISVKAPFEILKKSPVELDAEPDFVPRDVNVTDSFKQFSQFKVVEDFKESTLQVSESPFNLDDLSIRPPKYYEFPDGRNISVGSERYSISEVLFNPKAFIQTTSEVENFLGLHELIQKSVLHVDVDIRQVLLNNIIVVGGGSLLNGLNDRLYGELARLYPASKIRIQASSFPAERKFSTWIGGSILSSLGSFQQLWFTKAEYEEHGASFVSKKCQ